MAQDSESRIRWKRSIPLCLGGLLLLTLLFHALWGAANRRYLLSRIEQLRRSGEPMQPADFAARKVDPTKNAAIDLERAAGMLNKNSPAWKAYDQIREPIRLPMRAEEREAVEGIIADSADALGVVEQARLKPELAVQLDFKTPFFTTPIGQGINTMRVLSNLLAEGASLNHERGDDAQALRRLDRVVFISSYFDQYPLIIGHLVGIGCAALAADRAMQVAPDLKIGSGAGDASPQQVRELVEALLNDQVSKDGLVRSLRGERAGEIDALQAWANGVPTPGFPMPGPSGTRLQAISRYFLRPALYRSGRVVLEQMTTQLNVIASANDWASVRPNLPPMPRRTIMNSFVMMLLPSLDRAIETHFRGMTDRHLAATVLAIRWYAVEHNGQLPHRLEDLVPQYLPAVPADPMATGAKPLAYRQRPDSPIIYSVGPNGVDDGGSESPLPSATQLLNSQRSEWSNMDRVVHLTRQPRPTTEESN